MAFDFPNSPSVGQRVTGVGGIIYVWDGVKWASNIGSVTAQSMGDVGRNLIHNPLFNIAQRGAGPWAVPGYTFDRWIQYFNLDTLSSQLANLTDTDRSQIGDEAAKICLQSTFTGNAGAASQSIMSQPTEDVRRLANKTVTVSFWAKCNSGTPKLGVCINQNFGSGGSPSASTYTPATPVTLATTWQRYSVSLTIPSVAGKTLGTTAGTDLTQLIFIYSNGANTNALYGSVGVQSGTVQLWGVQLEIGSVATPLEKPDPRYDLSNCQRFYQTGSWQIYTGAYTISAAAAMPMLFPTTMRATPTATVNATSNTNLSGLATNVLGASGMTVFGGATAAGTINAYGTWTASADL